MDANVVNVVLQELLFDTSDSSDDEDVVIRRGPLVLRPRILHFVEEVVDAFRDDEFRANFRMHRTTFNYILNVIGPQITTDDEARGRHTISAKNQLLIAIWRFSTPDSYRLICSRFNIGKATALRTVRRVTTALLNIGSQIITWPNDHEREVITAAFETMGFPGTIGCIDGSYIKIPQPAENSRAYICRKNFSALILQGVCDHTMKFIHTTAGDVGSCHDARVLRNSQIWEYISVMPDNKFPDDCHLVGDKAYPLVPQLMTPYRNNGHLTEAQQQYNFALSSARNTIERAFGQLKKRFRCLLFLDVKDLIWAAKYIIACTILHNICILQNDILEVELDGDLEEGPEEEQGYIDNATEHQLRIAGRNKRERICREMNI